MIKNIVFDIGNIILSKNTSSVLDLFDINDEDKELIRKELFNEIRYIDLDYGLLDYRGYFDKYSYLIPERLHSIAYDVLSNSYKYRTLNNDILDLMSKLKNNNYNLFILSNNNKEVIDYLKKTKLNDYIDGWIVSYEYKEIKPNSRIYQVLFDKYKLEPSECYFIDDKNENIETAIKLGMKGFRLDWINNTFKDLIKDLEKNNVKVN